MLSDTQKWNATRRRPIPSVIIDELKKHWEIGNGQLFPSSIYPNQSFDYRKQWVKYLKAANIDNFRWHDLRHDIYRFCRKVCQFK